MGSDQLIRAALDALISGIESPSLAMLAGLLRSAESEAPELFDQALEELGLVFVAPSDPRAATWAFAYWIAGQIVDGSLDPAIGTYQIWVDAAYDLDYPQELREVVSCAINLDSWNEDWGVRGVPFEALKAEAADAAKRFLTQKPEQHINTGVHE
ncbi:hypothetical protein [Kitasatospora azatica]|uniref:hypothetical protein n=1 Tax=Kitasatospora azatica TaxID=58347 RepID=UPI001E3CBF54|nr:hypothetical protein [Kitasatospora azatica]